MELFEEEVGATEVVFNDVRGTFTDELEDVLSVNNVPVPGAH